MSKHTLEPNNPKHEGERLLVLAPEMLKVLKFVAYSILWQDVVLIEEVVQEIIAKVEGE